MASLWHESGRGAVPGRDELRMAALGMLRARRAMRGTLPAALIHDVALELLLTVFIAGSPGIDADELVSDTTVPSGSARRWLAALAAEDLVAIGDDRVSLSDEGSARMAEMLTSVLHSQRALLGWQNH